MYVCMYVYVYIYIYAYIYLCIDMWKIQHISQILTPHTLDAHTPRARFWFAVHCDVKTCVFHVALSQTHK